MRFCLHTTTILLTLVHLILAFPVTAERPGDQALYLEPDPQQRTLTAFYGDLYCDGKPMLITVDSALWAVHILHEQARAQVETTLLTPRLQTVLEALEKSLNASEEETPSWILLHSERVDLPPSLTEPARRARLYVQTAQLLLTGDANPPAALQGEWNRIQAHEIWAFSDIFEQKFDYATLEPRGQSLRTEALRRYYRTSRYLGNLILRLDQMSARKTGQPFDQPLLEGGWFRGIKTIWAADLKREEMAKLEAQYPAQGLVEMRAAALLSLILENTPLSPEQTVLDIWKEMDATETRWSGQSPDLDPPTLLASLKTRVPKPGNLAQTIEFLADDYNTLAWLAWLEARLKPLSYRHDFDLGRRGFSLLGRRYPTDSRILRAMRANETWPGRSNVPQERAFTNAPGKNGETIRGLSRGLDLLAAMGNAQAYLLLKREGDLQYFGMDRQKNLAEEVWKSSLLREKGFFRKLRESWRSESHPQGWPPESADSIEQILTLAIEQTAGALRPRKLPDYTRQTDHEFLRANSALAFWVSLQRESELVEPVQPLERPLDLPPATSLDTPPPGGATLPCYVDPYPTLYNQLARAAGNMAVILENSNPLSNPFVQNARAVEQLLKTLERVALQQTRKSSRISPEDQKTLCEWGLSLSRALELPPDEAARIGFQLDAPVPTIATLHNQGGATFQAGVGPLWSLTTTAPFENQDIQVTGAILPYFEAKRLQTEAYTAAQWRELHQKKEPLAPTLLRECTTFQLLLSRFPRFFEASYQAQLNTPVSSVSGKSQEPVEDTPSVSDSSGLSVIPVPPVFGPF